MGDGHCPKAAEAMEDSLAHEAVAAHSRLLKRHPRPPSLEQTLQA